MTPIVVLALGSLKALALLLVAWGLTVTLRRAPARLRAVIWSTALVGSLLIPAVAAVVPAIVVELPAVVTPPLPSLDPAPAEISPAVAHRPAGTELPATGPRQGTAAPGRSWRPDAATLAGSLWAGVALLLLLAEAASHLQLRRIVRRARPVTRRDWLDLAADARRRIGGGRAARLVISGELEVPAVAGIVRPVVVLPEHSRCWLPDRLEAVLQHELVHIARLDWPLRTAARLARSVYWFNPLVWWAVRRLELEQEVACDEEVLAMGSRASTYACHLLGIAHTAIHGPGTTTAGLAMARRSHLEERIMRLLDRSMHRRVGLAVILPAAVLTAALVPAIAAVSPTGPEPKTASPELRAAIAEMTEAERRIEPSIEQIEAHAIAVEPVIAALEEIEIDHEAIERIEEEMAPIIAQIEAIEIDMEPVRETLDELHEAMETMTFVIDDGTLEEVQRQIEEQLAEHQAQLESIHVDMAPYHERLEALHRELEPMHEQLARLSAEQHERVREQMEHNHEAFERQRELMLLEHEEIERIHREMAPLHEALEAAGERIEGALIGDVAEVLRSHLGPVTNPGTSFSEAAARIVDEGDIRVDDDVLEIRASRSEVREILHDLFSAERIGAQDAFDTALEAAVDEVSDLRIRLD